MDETALHDWWKRGQLQLPPGARVTVTGSDPVLASRHRPGEAAAAALGMLGAWAAYIGEQRGTAAQEVSADTRVAAASLLGFALQSVEGLDLSRYRTALTAIYPTADGHWIHLHGGFDHLVDGLTDLLGCDSSAESVGGAVETWIGAELEDAVAEAGLCAVLARTRSEWAEHPQGQALANLGAVTIRRIGDAPLRERPSGDRPLAGVRVVDLTRVLAGPTCGRSLAAHGADVLRIGSPNLPSVEPFVIETGHGKRSAFLDLEEPDGLDRLTKLVMGSDVFVESYRNGSLAKRGLGPEDLAALNPGLIHVSINCYGHVGPWAGRGGWEQLAQTTSGIAMAEAIDGVPTLLPAAATDYTTGYLAAGGTMMALSRQMEEGGSWVVEASLCQTSQWLQSGGSDLDPIAATGFGDVADQLGTVESSWGELKYLPLVEQLSLTPARWDLPPAPLGTHNLEWR